MVFPDAVDSGAQLERISRTDEGYESTMALEERNRRHQLGTEACWAAGPALYDQINRSASVSRPDVLLQTVTYLQQDIHYLSEGNPPIAVSSNQ